MKQNKFGEMIFSESDICDLMMRGHDLTILDHMTVDDSVNLDSLSNILYTVPKLQKQQITSLSESEFHRQQQQNWHMPQTYKDIDIAQYLLDLCDGKIELQRVAEELLLYQERDLFDLLRYLKYLVDVMRENNIIWGVGRGSSVASFILYKLGVHRINSITYKLNINEFLR